MGGVGKTALALKLAEELSPLYPDGQIFLDLKGVTEEGQTPLTPSEAMTHVIRAFHPEARLPEAEAELSGLYQSVLHGRRALLLMDNAADAPQVAPLSPPKGCLLLVTSRSRFTLPGLVARNLDELPHKDACDLLLEIEPRIGATASGIARLCDGLPFALRLAGGALAERSDLTPDSFVHRLAGEKERLGLVKGTLNLSVQLLPQELKDLWHRLAVFLGSFDADAAAAVWGLELDPALDSLGMLVRSSLLDGKAGRYRLHDLARLFADSDLDEDVRNESQARHAEHYLQVLSTADDLYMNGGESIVLALRLFDSEWTNIQAGQRWASFQTGEEKRGAELARDFPYFGAYVLSFRQSPRERIGWLQVALVSSRRLEDRRGEGNALGNMGIAYAHLGEFHRAIEAYEQHLVIAREIGDRLREGHTLGNMGLAYGAIGETSRAIELFEQDLAIAREIGDRRGEGAALGNMGLAYAALGEPQRAIELYEQQVAIAHKLGDWRGEGNALGNMGEAYADLGEFRRAIELYEQWLAIAREIGDRRGEGITLGNMGRAYAALGEPQRAIEFYEQDLAIARQIGDWEGVSRASWNLGLALEKQGDLVRAVQFIRVCVDYERDLGHPAAEAHASRVQEIRARLGRELSPEAQLWQSWVEGGPQGPIEDEDELP